MKHGFIVLLDIDLCKAWHPKASLTNALDVHSWWRRLREFELTGD